MSASDVAARPSAALTPTAARLAGLGIAFLACFALVPLEIDQIFGLPAHPLFLHVPVVFDPILAVVSIFFALRARARHQHGLLWAAFALVALAATVLAAGAGEAFMDNRPQVSDVLRDHKEAAETLRLLMFGLTAAIIVLVALDWSALRRRVPAAAATAVAVLVVVLSVGAGFFTVRAGHLGAKAAWGARRARRRAASSARPAPDQLAAAPAGSAAARTRARCRAVLTTRVSVATSYSPS